jgi:hypothetical protein
MRNQESETSLPEGKKKKEKYALGKHSRTKVSW